MTSRSPERAQEAMVIFNLEDDVVTGSNQLRVAVSQVVREQ